MRNLKLLKKNFINLPNNVLSSCLSTEYEDGLFCITSESIIFSNGNDLKNVVSDISYPFVRIQNGMSLYCSTNNSVISYDNFNGMELDSIEFDDNIIGLWLSPDASILIVLTDNLHFTILCNELQALTTFSLEQAGFGTAEPLSIGWGKKETQFHGKIGKDARHIVEKVNEHSQYDSQEPIMVWKEDGEFFAISWISLNSIQNDSPSGTRLIRVFSKDGDLFSTSEPTNVLENGMFWRTRSNLIVTSCRNNNGLEVVFFEQNGLRHGGFALYDKETSANKVVSSITFNSNDDICAVVIQDLKLNITQVTLFTTDNYHWYRKQTWTTTGLEKLSLFWSIDKLHTMSESGTHTVLEWYTEVDRTMVARYTGVDQSYKLPYLVAVIDGDKLLMTPFEFGVVPPPYCAFTINFPTNVSFVSLPRIPTIGDDDNGISCFVQLSNNTCNWLRLSRQPTADSGCTTIPTTLQFGTSRSLYTPTVAAVIEFDGSINNTHWINNDSFYCVVDNQLYRYRLDNSQIVQEKLPTGDILVGRICYNSQLYIQDVTGQVYRFGNENQLEEVFKYSTFCSEMYSLTLKSETNDVLIGFSSILNQLYINERMQPGSYLSVFPVANHLICTNNNQKLRCINLPEQTLPTLMEFFDEKTYKCDFDFDETFRLIEPGTKIITCVPGDSKIILMMPRGNLETIYPRALVLDELKSLMDSGRYSEAIETMRRQRVNLNLLYDHNPRLFMSHLDKLVRDNANNDRMVLLMYELSKENVTETMYKRFYSSSNNSTVAGLNGHSLDKVNTVCTAVVTLLANDITEVYINLILTCYVKMVPCASDKALHFLRTFKDNGQQKIWDKGLKYLQYLISIDDLYRVALSTYDLALTIQVAQKTQLDPKEYVTFINELNELPCEHYRRYKINIFLKRPIVALGFIVNNADTHWEEVVELITANGLYVKALELFNRGTTYYNIISSLFAEHLIRKSNDLKAAGMVYLRTNDSELCKLAADCFMKTHNWQEWFTASKKSRMDTEEIHRSLVSISSGLKDLGRHSEAIFINEMYLHNLHTAFDIALEGRLFTDAIRIMSSISDSTDECSVKISESVLKTYTGFMKQLEEYGKKFNDGLNRLAEVRLSLVQKFHELILAGEDETLPDFMSDTSGATSISSRSSVHSKMSNLSNTSSKFQLKKKKVKKQWSDKKDSQKEEIGLIENLHFNIKYIQSLTGDIQSLVEMLCYTGNVAQGSLLVKTINELLTLQSGSITVIWDGFMVDWNFDLKEDEIQISNHIRVSRGPKFVGRRRYLFDEPFLKNAPQMSTLSLRYTVCDI